MKFSPTQMLPVIEKKFSGIAPAIKRFYVQYIVPSNRSMGIRLLKVLPNSSEVELQLKHRRRNMNVSGSVNGGVLMAFAECVHGVAVLWQFSPANYKMVTLHSKMKYLVPGYGTLFTRFKLSEITMADIDNELVSTGACNIELSSTVTDSNDKLIAILTNEYQITRRS